MAILYLPINNYNNSNLNMRLISSPYYIQVPKNIGTCFPKKARQRLLQLYVIFISKKIYFLIYRIFFKLSTLMNNIEKNLKNLIKLSIKTIEILNLCNTFLMKIPWIILIFLIHRSYPRSSSSNHEYPKAIF